MKNFASIFLLIVFLFSCSAPKNVTQEKVDNKKYTQEIPLWVKERPASDFYYVGIGRASKKTSPTDFREVAKKNALNDLASGISVNISAQSVLSQLESNNMYKEEFRQDIKVDVNDQLQNYDEVAVYENGEEYWVYYQLSKSDYQAQKKKEVDAAIFQGLDYLKKANDFKAQNRFKESLLAYVSGMEKIKKHLDQSLETQFDGKTIYLGNELFNGYRTLLNEIVIDADVVTYRTKIGMPGTLKFSVKTIGGTAITSMPLQVEIKKNIYSYEQGLSDQNGFYTVNVGKVSRQSTEQYIQVGLDIKQILREAAVSSLISKLFALVTPMNEKVSIEALPVFVFIKSAEKVNGNLVARKWLDGAFRESLVSNGYIPVDIIDKADLVIEITANAVNAGSVKNEGMEFFSSTLEVLVNLKDKATDALIYQNNLTPIKGTQLSFDKAAEDAYMKAVKKIKTLVVNDMITVYLK